MKQVHALVVDDNVKQLGVLTRLLARQGVVCTEASNVGQLASVLQTLMAVDVVFFDLELPGVNSDEIVRQLKADARFNAVPFVGFSAQLGDANTAYPQEFHSFLNKPVDSETFPALLSHILSGESV